MRIFQRFIDRHFENWPLRVDDIWWQILAIPPAIQIFVQGLGGRLPLADVVVNFVQYWQDWNIAFISVISDLLIEYLDFEVGPLFLGAIPSILFFSIIAIRSIILNKLEVIPTRIFSGEFKYQKIMESIFICLPVGVIVTLLTGANFSSFIVIVLTYGLYLYSANPNSSEETGLTYLIKDSIARFMVSIFAIASMNFLGFLPSKLSILQLLLFALMIMIFLKLIVYVVFKVWRITFIVVQNLILLIVLNFTILFVEPYFSEFIDWYWQTRAAIEAN